MCVLFKDKDERTRNRVLSQLANMDPNTESHNMASRLEKGPEILDSTAKDTLKESPTWSTDTEVAATNSVRAYLPRMY